MAQEVGGIVVGHCDVTDPATIDAVFAATAAKWGTIDFIVHAIAFSDRAQLDGRYVDTTQDNFVHTMVVSCYSFTAIAQRAEKLMPNGGAMLTLTYYGAEKWMPHYNVMGIAKAGLEASVRYLAADLGTKKIRVNAISAGPIKTLAASGIGDFRYILIVERAQYAASPQRHSRRGRRYGGVSAVRLGPRRDLRLLAVLPAKPNSGADDTRGVLGELLEADADRGRVFASTLYAHSGARADPIYVHAKLAVIDDTWLTIGSANLNEHSLFNDTEMNIVTHDPALARETRLRLWSEHLELPIDNLDRDPIDAMNNIWKPISKEQLELRKAGQPLTHRLVSLPNVSKRSSRLLGPTTGLIVDG